MENQTQVTETQAIDAIAKWQDTASQALAVNARATASKDEKAKVFNDLAWQSLVILINNKVQDRVSLAKAVSKEGKFFALRQCVSNAKPLAMQALEHGFVTVPEGRGKKKTEKNFSTKEILESENPAFTVSTAYRNTLKNAETLETDETFTDDMAMALYAEAEGLDVKTIKDMGLTQEAITQGHILHGAAIKAEALAKLPELASDIKSKFSVIAKADKALAEKLLETLMGYVADTETETETELQNVA